MIYQEIALKINRNISLLAPKFSELVINALAECHEAGYPVDIFEAWRSPERQFDLFKQGRTSEGKTVTNASAWFSAHQYGVAVDLAFNIKGKWSWDGDFDKVISIFTTHGFDKPPSFEKVHFQVSRGLSIQDMRRITQTSGLQALWLTMDLI